MENKQLQESLKRYKQLLGYDEKKGGSSLTEKRERHTYLAEDELLNEADPEEGEETPTEGGENTDFDFGGGEGEETPTEGGEEGFGETPAEGEEETTDLGTADEFSAADEIEAEDSGDEVEEIDVTDIVKRADDAKEYAEKAVTAAEEGNTMIKDLMSQFEKLQASLSKIESVSNELTSIKKDIQSQKPKEKLELRSLDSYPFNVKLTDYWSDEKLKDNYDVTNSEGQQSYTLKPEDVKDYSESDIKKSFVPESKAKKKVLTENSDLLSQFSGEEKEFAISILTLLRDRSDITDALPEGFSFYALEQAIRNITKGKFGIADVIKKHSHELPVKLANNIFNLIKKHNETE